MKLKTETENGVKQTDIGLIPEDWEAVNIDDFVKFQRGSEPGRSNYNKEMKGVRFLRVVDVSGSREDEIYTTAENIKLCTEKDILITLDGSPGIIRKGLSGAYSSGIRKIVFTDKDLNQDYTYFVLQNDFVKKIIEKHTTGITIKHSSKAIPYIKIPLPSLLEQQEIAFVLSKLQQAIDRQKKIIAKTKELKRSLMHRLFTYGLRGEELKETEIGLMPKSWTVVRLRDYVELITKGSSPNWQGFEYCQGGITFVRSQNIGWGDLLLNEVQHLPESFNKKEKKSIIKENDVLVNLVGASIGRVAIATKVIEGGNLNQAVAIVRLRLNSFTPKFLVQYLLTQMGQKQIHLNKKEIARANISLQDVNNFLVVRPEMEEQEEISQTLKAVDDKINRAYLRHNKLSELFKSMLQLLMTGQVRVKDIDFGEINV